MLHLFQPLHWFVHICCCRAAGQPALQLRHRRQRRVDGMRAGVIFPRAQLQMQQNLQAVIMATEQLCLICPCHAMWLALAAFKSRSLVEVLRTVMHKTCITSTVPVCVCLMLLDQLQGQTSNL